MIPLIPLLIGGGLIAWAIITISKLINIIKGRFRNAAYVKVISNKIKSSLDNGNANVLKLGIFDKYDNKLGKDKIEGKLMKILSFFQTVALMNYLKSLEMIWKLH